MDLFVAGLALAGFFGGLALLKSALARLEPFVGPVLRTAVNSPVRGFLAGLVVTALIQSSSATNVMAVALVAAGALGLEQAVGIVLGANVGTTATGQLLAFGTEGAGLVLLAAGLAAQLPGIRRLPAGPAMRVGAWGEAVGGLGAVFLSLWCLGRALAPVADGGLLAGYAEAVAVNPGAALLFGVALTSVVQSSSAVTGLLIGWADQGGLTLASGIAALLGANIGTVTTTILAALPSGTDARRTAAADALFNIAGAVAVWPFLGRVEGLVAALSADPGRQIAHAHTLFNLATAGLLLPFVHPFCKLIRWLVPGRRNE